MKQPKKTNSKRNLEKCYKKFYVIKDKTIKIVTIYIYSHSVESILVDIKTYITHILYPKNLCLNIIAHLYIVYEKTITIEVPKWIDEEEIRFWIAEFIGRKMVKKLILEALSEKADLTKEERKLFEKARKHAWKDIQELYKRKGIIK